MMEREGIRRWAILGSFGALALAGAVIAMNGCTGPTRAARAPREGAANVSVMTYNVNYGLAGDRTTLYAIESPGADLVLLEETTADWETAIRSELARAYPHMEFHHCCGAGGLAVLSKRPIHAVEILPAVEGDGGWFPAMRAELESPLGMIQVLVVHLHPPISNSGSVISGYFSTPSIREAEIAHFSRSLRADYPTLIVGDFNEGSGGDAIEILEARGFRTVLPEFQPNADTWHWNTSVGEVSTVLDHVMYDPRFEPLEARVVRAGRSDHYPVVAVFEAAE